MPKVVPGERFGMFLARHGDAVLLAAVILSASAVAIILAAIMIAATARG